MITDDNTPLIHIKEELEELKDLLSNLEKEDSLYYYRELNNAKELLIKCKTLIADMVLVNLHRTGWDVDVMKRAQETLRELTEIIDNEK